MDDRQFSFLDRIIGELDTALRTVAAPAHAQSPNPAGSENADELTAAEAREAARLMRVNHSGEVAAQALYRGQALMTRDAELRQKLLRAAGEEYDHLAWCEERVRELGQRTSLLAPVWYGGSFAIGALAGLIGDRSSLGFMAETERQVAEHLNGHLHRLPTSDTRSRRILERMHHDEVSHGQAAIRAGGRELPKPVQSLMRATARVVTSVSYWL
jgi:ubiquinone biosynthesis monooxygenase Coq7